MTNFWKKKKINSSWHSMISNANEWMNFIIHKLSDQIHISKLYFQKKLWKYFDFHAKIFFGIYSFLDSKSNEFKYSLYIRIYENEWTNESEWKKAILLIIYTKFSSFPDAQLSSALAVCVCVCVFRSITLSTYCRNFKGKENSFSIWFFSFFFCLDNSYRQWKNIQ